MLLHLYNPSHDDALAAGTPSYNAPQRVQQMERDLALLPIWWAERGDGVVVGDVPTAQAFVRATGLPDVPLAAWADLPPHAQVAPWGWNAALVRRLLAAGVSAESLPSGHELTTWRHLSSRRTAVSVLSAVRRDLPAPQWVGRSRWAERMDDVAQALGQWPHLVAKAPWSCSGRGVFSLTASDAAALSRAERLIRRQGGVELEPYYRHAANLAMLFRAEATGCVRFVGLSLFAATAAGRYAGNVVARQAILAERVETLVGGGVLRHTAEALQGALAQTLRGRYVGCLGVDMMVCPRSAGSGRALHPCVEVNLRPTMGFLAMRLAEHLLPAHPLRLVVVAAQTQGALRAKVQALRHEAGADYRPLTPLTPGSLFHACLIAEGKIPRL